MTSKKKQSPKKTVEPLASGLGSWMSVYLDDARKRHVRVRAAEEGISISEYVRNLIDKDRG